MKPAAPVTTYALTSGQAPRRRARAAPRRRARGRRRRPRRGTGRRRSASSRRRRGTRRAAAPGARRGRARARAPGSGCPAASGSGNAPPKRGLTSVTGSEPSGSRKHWTFAGPTMPIVSATRAPCSISSASWSDRPLIDSPPFDWIIERGIALRQRPSTSQKTSIENSSPRQTLLHHRVDRRRAEVERELLRVVRAVDVARAEPLAHLDEQRVARVVRDVAGQPGARARDPVRDEELVREVLVPHRAADLGRRRQHERRRQRVPGCRDDRLVEVGERHDEA